VVHRASPILPRRGWRGAGALAFAMVLAACSQTPLPGGPDDAAQPATGAADGTAADGTATDGTAADGTAADGDAASSTGGERDGAATQTARPRESAPSGDGMPELDRSRRGAPVKPNRPGAGTIELKTPDGGPRQQTVGLLLPLSGDKAPLGESMLRAAELAMFDVATKTFNLVVRDTKGTPRGAEAAARSAIDAGANLLLGPVFSSSVRSVKPVADGGQVPVLAFSNNPAVAERGTYVMGLMPAQQVRRVVSYAIQQGRRNYAVLAPDNAYGELVVAAMRRAAERYGGRLHHTAYYPPGSQDVSDQVESLANKGFGEVANAAVMLPAGGKQLQTLAPTLPFFDIDPDKVQFLGTALWNDPSLGTEPALVGGWFAAPPPSGRAAFRKRYRETFATEPGELASLAYDATALASLLARRAAKADKPPASAYTADKLTQRNGFAGVDGVFRLNDDGTVQRLYAILEMQRNNLKVIDQAPSQFEPVIN
jgi:ABC-type branched-subunit amino acid transport system substrate-binding protein